MAWGSKGEDNLALENARLETRVEMMTEQIEGYKIEVSRLHEQLGRAQEALIAKESPQAYEDHRALRFDETFDSPEDQKQYEDQALINGGWLNGLEGPLFTDAEDMMDKLGVIQGVPEAQSLHGDGES